MANNSRNHREWLGLVIGNSRLHWGWFQGGKLGKVWDTNHLSHTVRAAQLPSNKLPPLLINHLSRELPLYIASVVPSQTALWETYSQTKFLTLAQIPLQGIYPTMGIDRALAVLGAGEIYGFPSLVIDAGTALTLTGVNKERTLVGGAILPGLTMQLQSLSLNTAALPPIQLPQQLPQRWALNTAEAIQSGVIYAVLAGIGSFMENWLRQFPTSQIVFTGGDANLLLNYGQGYYPEMVHQAVADPHLIFAGMSGVLSRTPIQ